MEMESLHNATDEPSETVQTSEGAGNSPSAVRLQVLTALAEIGTIQEEEGGIQESDTLARERKCRREVCFYRLVGPEGFGPVVKLKPSMSRVQELGRQLLKDKILPLFSTKGRELWTYVQLTLVLIFVLKIAIIDIVVSDSDKRTTVDFVSLGLSIFFLLLSFMDFCIIIFVQRCNLFCTPCHRMTSKSIADETGSKAIYTHPGCMLFMGKYGDVVRVILNEVMVYTIVICTMFQLILGAKQQSSVDLRLGFRIVSFIVAVLWNTTTVYGICVFVVIRAFNTIRKGLASTASRFHVHIFLYAIGLIVSQTAMFFMIRVKIDYENRNFTDTGNSSGNFPLDNTVRITGFLWFMLFCALIIPLAGIFVFAIPNFYSIQEYPIEYFLDLVDSVVSSGELSAQEDLESDKSVVQVKSIVQTIKKEFTSIHNKSVFKKYAYVFFSPLLVTLSIIYTLLILAFLVVYLLEPNPTEPVLYSSSAGWTVFFVIFGVLVGIPHILVLFIGTVWIAMISVLLILVVPIVLVIACVACICFVDSNFGRHCAESDCCYARRARPTL